MAYGPSPVREVTWTGPGDRTAVVRVEGDIDLHRSGAFQDELLKVVGQTPQAMVVDLSGVPYIDSSGVASLVKLLSRTRRHQISLRLAGPSARVRSVFEITKLDTVFEIFESVAEAVQE